MSYGALELHSPGFLDGFHAARVLCVGDVMLDRFLYGHVERVSPEAPIPILRVDSRQSMLGGVGNVGRNVVALGAHAVFIAVTGDDDVARRIGDLAASEERLTPRLIVEPGRPSTVKSRFLSGGQQLLRADDESTAPVSQETAERVVSAIRAELRQTDVMVLSDYMKGVFTDEVLAAAISEARVAGVPVIADPKRDDFAAYAGVTLLKPNRAELAVATRWPCENDADIEACAHKIIRESGIEAVMVTRSERGISLVRCGADPVHLAASAPQVLDVSGAGDTVVATTAVALALGADLAVAAKLANIAGGIVVGKAGTATVGSEELAGGLLAVEGSASEAKVMSTHAAVGAVGRWRKQGHKIGFTDGCFDVLHPGHVSLLSEARGACDRLIVAVRGDESLKGMKAEDRPVHKESARALVLASLSMVDLVVVFSERTPVRLLELLQPDVLIEGSDYAIDEAPSPMPGAEVE